MKKRHLLAGAIGTVALTFASTAYAEYYIGQVITMGSNFCPRGTLNAEGQTLPIAQNQALYSLYGTTYGGDARTTFALPDLRGRYVTSAGQGPGLSNRQIGQEGGRETVSLSKTQMPSHTHQMMSTDAAPNTNDSAGSMFAEYPTGSNVYTNTGSPNVSMSENNIASTGSSQPVTVLDPFLTMKQCIVIDGLYPSRP